MIYQDKIFKKISIDDPLAEEIINSDIFKRLKYLYNHSLSYFLWPRGNELTRYEHSIGVYLILRLLQASREEQIAGLLHDVSHTAFSHVADFAFGDPQKQDFQDSIHQQILQESLIPALLQKYGLSLNKILQEKKFTLLDRPLPFLCADRVDYFLRVALNYGELESGNISKLLTALRVADGRMVLTDSRIACWIAKKFLWANKNIWAKPETVAIFYLMGRAVKLAYDKKIISQADLFTTDKEFNDKMREIKDPEIKSLVVQVKPSIKAREDRENYDLRVYYKIRYLDPEVMVGKAIQPLSVIDKKYKKELDLYLTKYTGEYFLKIY